MLIVERRHTLWAYGTCGVGWLVPACAPLLLFSAAPPFIGVNLFGLVRVGKWRKLFCSYAAKNIF